VEEQALIIKALNALKLRLCAREADGTGHQVRAFYITPTNKQNL